MLERSDLGLELFVIIVILLHFLDKRSQLSCQLLFHLRYWPKFRDCCFILFVYSDFVFANESHFIFNGFNRVWKYLSDLMMTRLLDIYAHFNNELDMSSVFFKVRWITSTLLLKNLHLLLYLDQVHIHSIDFLIPFKWVNGVLYYLMILITIIFIIHSHLIISIEEIDFGFLSPTNNWFLLGKLAWLSHEATRRHKWMRFDFNSINDLVPTLILLLRSFGVTLISTLITFVFRNQRR